MRLPGHRLTLRGAPHTAQSCQQWPCDTIAGIQRVNQHGHTVRDTDPVTLGGHGHGLCQCGATGPHDLTGADRRRWHDRHKQAISHP